MFWHTPTSFTCSYFYLKMGFFYLFTRTKAKHSQPRAAPFAHSIFPSPQP